MASTVRKIRGKLREFALSLPETHEDLPWGERVVKVKKKVFAFLGRDMDEHFGLSVKLGVSRQSALALPFTAPTGYGLGKSGWVSAKFEPSARPSLRDLRVWVLESYCAVAPKKLAAQLSAQAPTGPTGSTGLTTKRTLVASRLAAANAKTTATARKTRTTKKLPITKKARASPLARRESRAKPRPKG